jgi:hypothetical protein
MAKCDFDISYSLGIDEAKKIITEEVTNNNGEIQISENKGKFTIPVPGGEVTGSVAFNNNAMSVNITDKPNFIPCGIIETIIQGYL